MENLATELQPLHSSLKVHTPWHWRKEQETAFTRVKLLVACDTVLTHYDPEKELLLATDASGYGLVCVLSNVMIDGNEKPIGFASHPLNNAQKGYPQQQKEALSTLWGVKKFSII